MTNSVLQANSKPVVDAVQVMASVIEHFEALQLPPKQQDSSASADLVWARSLWNSLTGSIFSASALLPAAALDEASGHSGVLHFINQCIELSHYVDGFQKIMHRCAVATNQALRNPAKQACLHICTACFLQHYADWPQHDCNFQLFKCAACSLTCLR